MISHYSDKSQSSLRINTEIWNSETNHYHYSMFWSYSHCCWFYHCIFADRLFSLLQVNNSSSRSYLLPIHNLDVKSSCSQQLFFSLEVNNKTNKDENNNPKNFCNGSCGISYFYWWNIYTMSIKF